jgi:hypothetical protein
VKVLQVSQREIARLRKQMLRQFDEKEEVKELYR